MTSSLLLSFEIIWEKWEESFSLLDLLSLLMPHGLYFLIHVSKSTLRYFCRSSVEWGRVTVILVTTLCWWLWHYMDLRDPWLHPLGCYIFQYCKQMFAFLQFVAIFSNTATKLQNISNFGCCIGTYSNKKLQKTSHLVAILKIQQPRGATKGLGRPYNEEYNHEILQTMKKLDWFIIDRF